MRAALLLIVLFGASGCATDGAKGLSPAIEELQAETKAVRSPVALDDAARVRTDRIGGPGRFDLRSGEIMSKVFVGDGTNKATLTILSATADWSLADLGFTGMFTYRVTAILTTPAQKHSLTATGVEKAHGMRVATTYAQIACERAAVDLAKQVQALIK